MILKLDYSGLFNLAPPYDKELDTDSEGNVKTIMTVAGINTISNLLNQGKDIRKLLYTSKGLKDADFNNALKANLKIITLTGDNGKLIMIPEDYVNGIPDTNYIPYYSPLLYINLGFIPVEYDLTAFKEEIGSLTSKITGIELPSESIGIISTAEHKGVDSIQHENWEMQRKSKVTNSKASVIRVIELERENDELRKQIRDLQDRLLNAGLIGS